MRASSRKMPLPANLHMHCGLSVPQPDTLTQLSTQEGKANAAGDVEDDDDVGDARPGVVQRIDELAHKSAKRTILFEIIVLFGLASLTKDCA